MVTTMTAAASSSAVTLKPSSTRRNHELLQNLGLIRIPMSASHFRKRLAVDARHYGRTGDSHMFIVKLPPSQHFYSQSSALPSHAKHSKVMGFTSNGQPANVYHWNIPVVKKMTVNDKRNRRLSTNNVHKLPSYYIPSKTPVVHKYLSSANGKPHSFYVINKAKKHMHKLLP